ncbi:MAG: TusE/DsrC/DsvC family sulfur relay protein [Planctomycetales bacterium]|nr:TusE/DsrC/DsvC family sulfur relay protein [Planctomycetales bacterium]
MDKEIAGMIVAVNDEGYLTNLEQWTKEIGEAIAGEENIAMTEQHWKVIEFLQHAHRNSEALSIRSLGKHGPVSIKEFYVLFPGGPLKKASRIAGIPKPASCV